MDHQKINSTRRQFIGKSALAVAIGSVGVSTVVAKQASATTKPVKFVKSSCGSAHNNNPKVLVTYASQFGSTGEIGQAIGRQICSKDVQVDIMPINDAVIIGSAIQYDKWMPEAVEFTKRHQSKLKTIPVGLFFSCLTLSRHDKKSKRQAQTYADNLARDFKAIAPIGIGQFAGVLDFQKIPPLQRILARGLFAFLRVKEGDHRNWSQIAAWAKHITPQLLPQRKHA